MVYLSVLWSTSPKISRTSIHNFENNIVNSSVVFKDLWLQDKDKDLRLNDKDKELRSKDKKKDL